MTHPSPQIPQNPNGLASTQIPPPPSIDLTSISSTQHPNPNLVMTSSAPNPNLQNLQRSASGSMARLTPHRQKQLEAAIAASYVSGGAQMSFGGAQIGQHAGMTRIGQAPAGQRIPMLPGQTTSQFNAMQAHMLLQQPRQNAGLVQGLQFNTGNSLGQALQGIQTMGMMDSLRMDHQHRANGPLSYAQHFNTAQIRQRQQMSIHNALASPPKLPGQSLSRRSSLTALSPQFFGLTQNGQSTSVQNSPAQPLLKKMQPSISSPVSPSHHLQQRQRQQHAFLPSPTSSSQLQHLKLMGLNQHQITQLVHQQVQLISPRQPQSQHQQLFPQQQQQQQSPRMHGSGFQKTVSLTGSQPGTPASVTTNTGGNSSQGAETSNQLLGKRKIQDLVSQVDPLCKLDPVVEDLLLEMADEFIDSVTTFACSLAKHRKSSTLESKDILLHLEKNLHLMIPGFAKVGQKYQKAPLANDVHTKRLESIRASTESQPFENDPSGVRITSRPAIGASSLNRPPKP